MDEERTVRVGEAFEIERPTSPSTGYVWEIAEIDSTRLHILAQHVDTPLADDMRRYGGSAIKRFTFQAYRAGDAAIALVYHRPWRPDDHAQRATITVHIKE